MQNLVTVSHTVRARYRMSQKNFGHAGASHPLIWWAWQNTQQHTSPRVMVSNLLGFRSNRMGLGRGPKIFGEHWGPYPLGWGVAVPSRNTLLCHVLLCQIWSSLVKPYGRKYGDPPEKNFDPSRPPFKVTQGHWNWRGSIDYLWQGPWYMVTIGLVPFPRSTAISVENRNFSKPRVFNAPLTALRECHLQLYNVGSAPPRWRKHFKICAFV